VKHIVAAAKAMRADMVVIDTLARTFGDGDENLAADMGAFVVGVDAIREETGAHCLIVHHGARTGTNSRGSSALDGAADTIIKVERGEQGAPHVATVAASKDDADGTAMHFTLRVVELGEDEDGDPRTTCVAVEAEPRTKKGKLRPKAAEALDALHELVASAGLPLPAGPVATEHPHLRCVPLEVWRSKLAGRAITDAWAGATERSAWKRVFDELNGARLIGVAGNPRSPGAGSVVWPTQMKGLA
jgi:hypothetical protein